eukprot:scaffold25272_cov68-Attheya_sp.AAC.1
MPHDDKQGLPQCPPILEEIVKVCSQFHCGMRKDRTATRSGHRKPRPWRLSGMNVNSSAYSGMASSCVACLMIFRVVVRTTFVRLEDHSRLLSGRSSGSTWARMSAVSWNGTRAIMLSLGMPKTRRPRVISPGVNVLMASARDACGRGGKWGSSDSPVMVVSTLVFSMPIWMPTGLPSVSIRWRNHSTSLGGRR